MNRIIRARKPIGLTLVAPAAGFLALLCLEKLLGVEVPRLQASVINLSLVALLAFVAFPNWLGIPFGRIKTGDFLRRAGFYLPPRWPRHVLLGLFLAACTLSGMFAASWSTGKYVMDAGRVSLTHLVFSLNPALWEELFYRGVLVFVLMRTAGSLRKAAFIQVLLFGLMHVRGFGPWDIVDALSVSLLAAGFTYVAWKTGALAAGIVFHYFHDALLFLVQVPAETVWTNLDRLAFYTSLWVSLAAACVIANQASKKLAVRAPAEFYPPT